MGYFAYGLPSFVILVIALYVLLSGLLGFLHKLWEAGI